ncbi:F0F1 ATP synthase subunit A [Anaerovorax odorimutans]|uniref:F0F1 ATP synthase subunit A n=1 Tax=Anaerovorax odorimutans TaxID=109327 RepID=UPI0003FC3B7C|nr:F0F1 ATP synthase subunit A [Anaerovorax odorimutans]
MELGPRVIFSIGKINFTETIIWAWIICIVLIAFAFVSTRKMEKIPKGSQAVAELIVEFIYKLVRNTMGKEHEKFAPYIGTLFMFLILANSLGLIDQRPVTADINTTFALAGITFFLIHYNSIRSRSFKGYIKHMADPYPFMLPINVIGDLAFPLSLSFRLFGNITAGMIVLTLIYGGLEGITQSMGIPIPFLQIGIPLPAHAFFDIFEPILQAFIFNMLTMVFIAIGMISANESH